MFMRGLGREIHHCSESNLCPTRDSDWHLPSHKETFLALVHWIYQPRRRRLFMRVDNRNWLFCLASGWLQVAKWNDFSARRQMGIVCDTVWWANHFLKWGEHIVPCITLLFVFQWRGLFLTYYVGCCSFEREAGPKKKKKKPIMHHNKQKWHNRMKLFMLSSLKTEACNYCVC